MRCHPIRWLWGLIPVAMLTWLAVHLESAPMARDLERRSGAALSAAGQDWASVAFAGRDGLLVGNAASVEQRDEAATLVRNVWGVRIVETRVALAKGGDLPPPMPEPKPKSDRGPAPWTKVGLPVASAANEISPRRTLNDVVPSAVGGPSADDVALATGDIGRTVDLPPASTVQARDEVEPTAPPATVAAVRTEDTAQPPASVDARPDAGTAAPLPEHKAMPATDAPEVPARKPAIADVVASPETVAAASSPPPVPEHKPEPLTAPAPPAAVTMSLAEPQKLAPTVSLPSDAQQPSLPAPVPPPLPQRGPRFETAALPPSNIGPEADCVAAVRSAAGPVEVHFAHGRAKLDTRGKALIDRLIGALNTCPEAALNVAGHSDASGHARRNLALSKRRARTVTGYMVHKGIDAGRLVAIGYGDQRPVAPNDTQANRAKNRRIEVAITARAALPPPLPVRKQGTEHGLSRR